MAKILAVVGGKGGTGKTLLAINLAYGLSKLGKTLLIDADVDNPCSKTFLRAEPSSREIVKEFRPRIIEDRCRLCGVCVQNCHSHALILIPGKRVMLSSELCEGCGVCKLVCPFKAIEDSWIEAGLIEEYRTAHGFDAIVGELKPTTRRTPVMILKTLRYAEKRIGEYDYAVADSPPGTGSGIYAIMSYANLIIAVTEPTRLGLSDLEKLYKLYEKTRSRKLLVAVNKSGLRGGVKRELEKFLEKIGVEWIEIPYDESVVRSYAESSILIEKYPRSPAAEAVKRLLERVSEILS